MKIHGEEEMCRQHVARWCRSFKVDRQNVKNHKRAESGRPSSSKSEINKASIEEMIQND